MYLMQIEEIKMGEKNKVLKIVFAILIAVIIVLAIGASAFLIVKQQKQKEQKILTKTFVDHNKYIEIQQKSYSKPENFKQKVERIYYLDNLKQGEKRAFLTFDDGPSENVTPLILDVLKNHGIKATFFELGSRVNLYPNITKRVYEEGHYIANHGYTHIYSKIYESPEKVLEEYNKTEEAIREAIQNKDYNSQLFRFPGGSTGGRYQQIKAKAIEMLNANNIAHIDWNALTGDAEGKHTKEDMIAYVKETIGTKRNVIILMHDAGDKILTYEILPELIEYLKQAGYTFKNFYDL